MVPNLGDARGSVDLGTSGGTHLMSGGTQTQKGWEPLLYINFTKIFILKVNKKIGYFFRIEYISDFAVLD